MSSIIFFCISFALMLIFACILYLNNYVKEAILLREAAYIAALFYIFVVLYIGALPIRGI